MVWAAACAAVNASNDKRNARARAYRIAAILSNNPFLVSLRTFVAQIHCKHWRSSVFTFRCPSTRQGVRPLVGAPGGLSAAITAPNRSGPAGLSVDVEFSLICLAILAGIVSTNSANGLCHPRHVWAWLSDTFSAHSLINLSGARFASHSAEQFASHNGGQFLTHSAATVCIIQRGYGLHHSGRQQ